GVEPSCIATIKDDSAKLIADEASARVADRVQTLAQYLLSIGAELPDLSGVEALVQPHCHQSSIFGNAADKELLARAGVTSQFLGGCCGLAGNFGVEQGHYETSVAVAEVALLPALRKQAAARTRSEQARSQTAEAGADEARLQVVLADGYSCRPQRTGLGDAERVAVAGRLVWGWGLGPRACRGRGSRLGEGPSGLGGQHRDFGLAGDPLRLGPEDELPDRRAFARSDDAELGFVFDG